MKAVMHQCIALYISYCSSKGEIDKHVLMCLSLEKKWNFLLKHTSGNVQEISNEIYCSKTVVIPYLGNITCLGHFLASMEISDFIYFF